MAELITTPEGRIVGGHPLNRRAIMKKGAAVMQADGVTPATEAYIGLAIPKTPGVDWKQTEWGQAIVRAANAGWTAGQPNLPNFAWKVTDGDSTVPNSKGIPPCTREGYPGHWVLQTSTQLPVKAYHVNKYDPIDQIQIPGEIQPGDYGRLQIEVKANFPAESPGVYLNPTMFELRRKGELIVLDSGPSAAEAFGGGAPATTAAAPPPVAPATDFLNPAAPPPAPAAVTRIHAGQAYTEDALRASGWSDAQIAALPTA